MYLHRVIIKNFRSIEYIDITFAKGKNIIVGKNNCGKSNIIKAIDLVLGERPQEKMGYPTCSAWMGSLNPGLR